MSRFKRNEYETIYIPMTTYSGKVIGFVKPGHGHRYMEIRATHVFGVDYFVRWRSEMPELLHKQNMLIDYKNNKGEIKAA